MDKSDLDQIAESLDRAVAELDGAGVRKAVTEFGWHDLLGEEEQAAVGVLFELAGRRLLPGSFLDDVLVAASGLSLAEGQRVLLPPPGMTAPEVTISGDRVRVRGVLQSGDGPWLVFASREAESALVRTAPQETAESVAVLDRESGWVAVDRDLSVEETLLLGEDAVECWRRMRMAGLRAQAHELVALGSAMTDMTVEHVTNRQQFGQALGSFQAVKHKLADVTLWQNAATLAVEAAWEDARSAEYGSLFAAILARRFLAAAREHCQQLLGGMGFTFEHDFHRYLRRALTVETLFGGLDTLRGEAGVLVREGRLSPSLAVL